jgi:hypothetical protein
MRKPRFRDLVKTPVCAPWSAFAAPNARGFVALLEAFRATGGTAPGEIVGRLLDEHQVGHAGSLARLVDTGQVFGFEWRASLWIPMFQFNPDDLALKAGAQRARAELPPQWSGWRVASWFVAPSARLDGRCPADVLDLHLESVLQVARALHPHEGLQPSSAAGRSRQDAVHA